MANKELESDQSKISHYHTPEMEEMYTRWAQHLADSIDSEILNRLSNHIQRSMPYRKWKQIYRGNR